MPSCRHVSGDQVQNDPGRIYKQMSERQANIMRANLVAYFAGSGHRVGSVKATPKA